MKKSDGTLAKTNSKNAQVFQHAKICNTTQSLEDGQPNNKQLGITLTRNGNRFKKMAYKKSPAGSYGITTEAFKNLGREGFELLHQTRVKY